MYVSDLSFMTSSLTFIIIESGAAYPKPMPRPFITPNVIMTSGNED